MRCEARLHITIYSSFGSTLFGVGPFFCCLSPWWQAEKPLLVQVEQRIMPDAVKK